MKGLTPARIASINNYLDSEDSFVPSDMSIVKYDQEMREPKECTAWVLYETLKLIPVGKLNYVLDACGGTGLAACYFAKKFGGSCVVNLDEDRRMLQASRERAASRNLKNVECVVADAGHLPFRESVFDLVTCYRAMINEKLDDMNEINNRIKKKIMEFKRAAKLGSSIVATRDIDPQESYKFSIESWKETLDGDRKLMEECGLSETKKTGTFFPTFNLYELLTHGKKSE